MQKADDDLKAITVKFPNKLVAKVDAWMKRKAVIKRSDGIRMLVGIGLQLDPPGKGKIPDDVQALIDRVEEDRREIEQASRDGKAVTLVEAYDRMMGKREQALGPAVVKDEDPKPSMLERLASTVTPAHLKRRGAK